MTRRSFLNTKRHKNLPSSKQFLFLFDSAAPPSPAPSPPAPLWLAACLISHMFTRRPLVFLTPPTFRCTRQLLSSAQSAELNILFITPRTQYSPHKHLSAIFFFPPLAVPETFGKLPSYFVIPNVQERLRRQTSSRDLVFRDAEM